MTNAARGEGLTASRERPARTASGYPPLLIALAVIVLGVPLAIATAVHRAEGGLAAGGTAGCVLGTYRGTERRAGLRWVLPWFGRRKISLRATNVISDKLKVNDLRGNPIEIAAQVVWRVVDTAQARFDVQDYKAFVRVQMEAAVRSIGSRYAYDDIAHAEVTLRGNHEVVNRELRAELILRLAMAGITVDECALTHLAYAPEIAGAMLRRQQAEAVVAARAKVVEGAVGMVEMALARLAEHEVVALDDERRAAMVSNLMVVLCADRDTQPVVNTGTLYQ